MAKKKEEFKILSPREHVRKRGDFYLGGTSYEERERFVLGQYRKVKYVPALLKLVDEIFDNCVDEHIRTDFKKADIIDITIKGDTVTITDNGRGLPHDKVETPDGEKILRPLAAWTKTMAGTNFNDDDRTTIGMNGLGSSLVSFFSTDFVGRTWRDMKEIKVTSKDGGNPDIGDNPKAVRKTAEILGSGTSVQFTPDFSLMECDSIEETIHHIVQDRLISLSVCFPKATFRFNGRKIGNANFEKYLKMYGRDNVNFGDGKNIQVAIVPSEEGFCSNSFINGVNTVKGGSYIDYICDEVANELLPMIKRSHKISLSKKQLKNGFGIVLFANDFVNPKFDTQTKEKLTNTTTEIKAHLNENLPKLDFNKVAKSILNNTAVMEPIIRNELAKQKAKDEKDARKEQKSVGNVVKHVKAQKKGGMLLLTEGDSASGMILVSRNKKTQGALPLRGVGLNTWELTATEVLKNQECKEIAACMGLDIFDPNSVDSSYYHDVGILTDADQDGVGHISPLLMAYFYKFWPRLFDERRIHVVKSPILITEFKNGKKKETIWSYTYSDAEKVKAEHPNAKFRYIKGLGSLTKEEYKKLLSEPVLQTITVDDESKALFDMMFKKKKSGNKTAPEVRREYMIKTRKDDE